MAGEYAMQCEGAFLLKDLISGCRFQSLFRIVLKRSQVKKKKEEREQDVIPFLRCASNTGKMSG